MKKVSLPNMPATRAQDYELDGKYCRVIYKPKETFPDRVAISAQAFEIDAKGNFAFAPNGEPSRTHGTDHTVYATNLGDTHSLKPAWVRQQMDANLELAAAQEVAIVDSLPKIGEVGDRLYCDPYFYTWVQGTVLDICDGKAKDLFKLLNNSAELHDLSI